MKFILTPELGRLAKWLRILGFDTIYYTQTNLSSLLIQALRDKRVILTRNSHFIHKAQVIKSLWIKSDEVNQQLRQVIKELDLRVDKQLLFSRCIICNVGLKSVRKQCIINKVPEYVFKTQDEFYYCSSCQRIYWPGTHWGNVAEVLEEVQHGICC